MINVLQRLAELDGQNPNVVPAKPKISADASIEAVQRTLSEELSVESLRYLSGVKATLEECGMMPGMESMMPSAPAVPASFSINASASNGDEVASMLTQIMNLAGVKPVGSQDMPLEPNGPSAGNALVSPGNGNDEMKRMIDVMNEPRGPGDNAPPEMDAPEDEGLLGTMAGAGLGAALGGPLGAAVGGAAGDSMTDPEEGLGEEPPVDIAGVGGGLAAAALSGGDPEEIAAGVEAGQEATEGDQVLVPDAKEDMRRLMDMIGGGLDNAPNDPNDIPKFDSNKMAYQPNDADVGDRMDGTMPKGFAEDTMTQKLFNDYQQFMTEGSKVDQNKDGKNDWEDVKIARMKASGAMSKDAKVKEDDVEESGLQYYTGVKKHGEKYMKAAAAAGRNGASQAELGALKDRLSKAHKGKVKSK